MYFAASAPTTTDSYDERNVVAPAVFDSAGYSFQWPRNPAAVLPRWATRSNSVGTFSLIASSCSRVFGYVLIPCVSGAQPVRTDAQLTSVTVGATACACQQLVPFSINGRR